MFWAFAGLGSTTAYLPYATARSLDSFEEIVSPLFALTLLRQYSLAMNLIRLGLWLRTGRV